NRLTNDVLFEIGLEEVRARFIDDAETQLINKTKKWLKKNRIYYQEITSYSTTRRLAVLILEVKETQATVEEEVRGTSLNIAKDDEENWTKAAIGFTKGQGKTVGDLYTKEVNGTPYVFIKNHIKGKYTVEILRSF